MMATIKKLMKSFLGTIVLLVIIVGMAAWGIEDIFRGNLGGSMVEAGSRSLSADALDRRVENVLRNLNDTSEKPLNKNEAVDQGIVDQVFAIEISKVAHLGYANQIGAIPPDEKIIEQLEGNSSFANPLTGEFDLNTYTQVLNQNRLSPSIYEEQLKDDISLGYIRSAATSAITSPELLTTLQASYFGETRELSYFMLAEDETVARPAPTEEELTAFYDENKDIFKQPERRAIDLLKLSNRDFISQVVVTDDEVQKIYDATKAQRFSAPDTRTIETLTFTDREVARTAFGFLAGGRSADSITTVISSSTQTGERDILSNELAAEALFGQGRNVGALFGPIENADGNWDIQQVTDIQSGEVYPLESVSDVIRDELSRERAEVLFFEGLTSLDNAIGAGFSLDEIASELGVMVMSFEPVDANGFTANGTSMTGLLQAQDAFQSAFEYGQGELGDRYDSDEAIYLAVTRNITPEITPLLADIREEVMAYYINRTSGEALRERAEEIEAQVLSGAVTFAESAENANAVIESLTPPISRLTAEQSGLPSNALAGIFAAQEGDILMFPTRLGDQILMLQMNRINRPATDSLGEFETAAAASIVQSLEQDVQAAIESEIRTRMDLRTNDSAFAAYKTSIMTEQ
jgi:peptidyl-prolyl cis-trans isomerase D